MVIFLTSTYPVNSGFTFLPLVKLASYSIHIIHILRNQIYTKYYLSAEELYYEMMMRVNSMSLDKAILPCNHIRVISLDWKCQHQ